MFTTSVAECYSGGEIYATRVLSDWKGNNVADACIAATQLGLIHSGSLLAYYRAKEILREEFDRRKVDDVNWSTVNDAFQNGRSAVISRAKCKPLPVHPTGATCG
jgi:hypothetical protein